MRSGARSISDLDLVFSSLGWLHRWAGLLLCVPVLLWFFSGAVMLFAPFPSLSEADRIARSAVFDPARVSISPQQAVAIAEGGDTVRLTSVAGRAAYVITLPVWPVAVFAADTGAPLRPLTPAQAKGVAEAFGRGHAERVEGPIAQDPWIALPRYDGLRPFYRVSLSGPDGVQLYVSSRTGEVVQRTTSISRFWSRPGVLLHWAFLAPLNKQASVWSRLVGWAAQAAVLMTAAGLLLGLAKTVLSAWGQDLETEAPGSGASPVWLERHYILGLLGGVFTLAWLFTGWLTVAHGPLPLANGAPAQPSLRYTGITVSAAAGLISLDELRRLGPSSNIEIRAVGGQAFAVATGGPTPAARVLLASSDKPPSPRLPDTLLRAALDSVLARPPGQLQAVPPDDFYARAQGLPASAVMAQALGGAGPRIYLDSVDGRLLSVMDDKAAAVAWLTYGLHGLRFPGLVERPALRTALLFIPWAVGFALTLSGLLTVGVRLFNLFDRRKPRRRSPSVLRRTLDEDPPKSRAPLERPLEQHPLEHGPETTV